jgi:hypothetical protein
MNTGKDFAPLGMKGDTAGPKKRPKSWSRARWKRLKYRRNRLLRGQTPVTDGEAK